MADTGTTSRQAADGRAPADRRGRRILLVAEGAVPVSALEIALTRYAAAGPARFHLVVPLGAVDAWSSGWAESEHIEPRGQERLAYGLARLRLARRLRELRARGLDVDGEVGAPDPFVAVTQSLRRRPADLVVVARAERASWARDRLVRRLRRRCETPVDVLA